MVQDALFISRLPACSRSSFLRIAGFAGQRLQRSRISRFAKTAWKRSGLLKAHCARSVVRNSRVGVLPLRRRRCAIRAVAPRHVFAAPPPMAPTTAPCATCYTFSSTSACARPRRSWDACLPRALLRAGSRDRGWWFPCPWRPASSARVGSIRRWRSPEPFVDRMPPRVFDGRTLCSCGRGKPSLRLD